MTSTTRNQTEDDIDSMDLDSIEKLLVKEFKVLNLDELAQLMEVETLLKSPINVHANVGKSKASSTHLNDVHTDTTGDSFLSEVLLDAYAAELELPNKNILHGGKGLNIHKNNDLQKIHSVISKNLGENYLNKICNKSKTLTRQIKRKLKDARCTNGLTGSPKQINKSIRLFDENRRKYDEGISYHRTLPQPNYIKHNPLFRQRGGENARRVLFQDEQTGSGPPGNNEPIEVFSCSISQGDRTYLKKLLRKGRTKYACTISLPTNTNSTNQDEMALWDVEVSPIGSGAHCALIDMRQRTEDTSCSGLGNTPIPFSPLPNEAESMSIPDVTCFNVEEGSGLEDEGKQELLRELQEPNRIRNFYRLCPTSDSMNSTGNPAGNRC